MNGNLETPSVPETSGTESPVGQAPSAPTPVPVEVPALGTSPLGRVNAVLTNIEARLAVERGRIATAQAIIETASKAVDELEADKKALETTKAALEQAAADMAQLTEKYSSS